MNLFAKRYFYFAYGSNMLRKRLEDRVGKVADYGKFTLPGYELQFNCGTSTTSYANVIANPSKNVEGVLYKLTMDQLFLLDYYEGAGWLRYYNRVVEVVPFNKTQKRTIFLYASINIREDGLHGVSEDYMQCIMQGYAEHGISLNREQLAYFYKFEITAEGKYQ